MALLFLLCWGGVQWVVLHDVDRYRPQVVATLSRAMGSRVEVGALTGEGFHWLPTLALERIVVFDPQGNPGVTVKRLLARVDLVGFFRGRVDFDRLILEEPDLILRRSATGKLFLSGIPLPEIGQGSSPFLDWFMHQGEIQISGGRVIWRDEQRHAPDLNLRQVNLRWRNGSGVHRFNLSFAPPSKLSTPLQIKGVLRGNDVVALADWQGTLEAQAEQVDWVALTPWIEALNGVERAQGRLQLTLELTPARGWEMLSEVDLHPLVWHIPGAERPLEIARLQGELRIFWHDGVRDWHWRHVRLIGKSIPHFVRPLDLHFHSTATEGQFEASFVDLDLLHPFENVWPLTESQRKLWHDLGLSGQVEKMHLTWKEGQDAAKTLGFSGQLQHVSVNAWNGFPALHAFTGEVRVDSQGGSIRGAGLASQWALPGIFVAPLQLQSFQLDTAWQRQEDHWHMEVHRLQVTNSDLSGKIQGSLEWGAAGLGQAHLQGDLTHARPEAVWSYIPLGVSSVARNWLKQALQGGEANPVKFEVAGDLPRFPFVDDQGGTFRVSTELHGVGLRFDPAWPAVAGIDGTLTIQGGALDVQATSGSIQGARLQSVHARIADMTRQDAVLMVTGEARGGVVSGLQFIDQSPVNGYLDHALDGWTGSGEGHLNLALQIPLFHPENTHVQGDYEFLGASVGGGVAGVLPPLSNIRGHILFSEKSLTSQNLQAVVLGGPAALAFTTDPQGTLHLHASGKGDWSQLRRIYDEPILTDVTGSEPWEGEFAFAHSSVEARLWTQGLYLGEPFVFTLGSKEGGGVDLKFVGTTSRSALQHRFRQPLLSRLEGPVSWEGHVMVKGRQVQVNVTGVVPVLGAHTGFVATRGPHHTLRASFAGHVTAATLRHELGGKWGELQGETDWSGRVEQKDQRDPEFWMNSSLVGLSLGFPAPLHKEAGGALPLVMHLQMHGAEQEIQGQLGTVLGAHLIFQSQPSPQGRNDAFPELSLRQGRIWLGQDTAASSVNSGLSLEGQWPQVNLDAWQSYLPLHQGELAGGGGGMRIAVRFGEVVWNQRRWPDVRVDAALEGERWNVHAYGTTAEGDLVWNPAPPGNLQGHFVHLIVPARDSGDPSPASSSAQWHAQDMPDVNLQVDHFVWPAGLSGQLHLVGIQHGGGEWRLERLEMDAPTTQVETSGVWRDGPIPSNLYTWRVKTDDLGRFLDSLGYPGLISRGSGEGHGTVGWPGSPQEFSLNSLEASAVVNLSEGQFSKVQPGGMGRLIGLFSLQTLPRRITLDFHDVFSEGFAFDHLDADLKLVRGLLETHDFEMEGPAARVKLQGKVNLVEETSDLVAKVVPAVGGSVTLASTVVGGPVAGAASYLLQKLFGNPLDQALTYEYTIQGSWDDPLIQPFNRP
ncbi:MAG: DUF748 domain-containing protein [Ferrovum sp.]|nr:DUF748 domain-containing protein [Ferrovum sp.]